MSEEFEKYRADQASRWLEHVMASGAKVRSLQAEIDEQREIAAGVSSPAVDGMPRARAATADALPDAVARIESLIAEYCAELAAYVDEQREAHRALSAMPNAAHAEALKRRYLLCRPWPQVSEEMGYTKDGMMKMRRRALCEAYDVMPANWRDPRHPAI